MSGPDLGDELHRVVERMIMSITDDIMHSLKDGPIGAGLLFRRVRDMRQGHLTHQYFDTALTKLTADGRIKGVIMTNEPDMIPEMGSPEDNAPTPVTLFDIKCIALDHAIHAVGARTIDNPATHIGQIVDAAQRFENYLMGVVDPPSEKKKAKQSSGGMVKYPDEISVKAESPMAPAGPPYLYDDPQPEPTKWPGTAVPELQGESYGEPATDGLGYSDS